MACVHTWTIFQEDAIEKDQIGVLADVHTHTHTHTYTHTRTHAHTHNQ